MDVLTGSYYEHLIGIGVTTLGECPHSNVVFCVWFKGTVAVDRLIFIIIIIRHILARDVVANYELDDSHATIINDVVR